jgi:hypothetical protein
MAMKVCMIDFRSFSFCSHKFVSLIASINALLIDFGRDRTLNFDQFCVAMEAIVKRGMTKRSLESDFEGQQEEGPDGDDSDDDDDEDNALQPQWKILMRAGWMMGLGTVGK